MMIAALFLLALDVQQPAPIPDEAARKQADKVVRDLFKEDFSKIGPVDRTALGRKLYQQALESQKDPASCYVLLSHAEDCAIQAGDAELLGNVLEATGKTFQVDILARKEMDFQKLPSRTPEDAKRCASAWMKLSAELLGSVEFDRAEKAAANASAQARKAKDIQSISRADALAKDVADLKAKYRGLVQAKLKLSTEADDPEANLLIGRFECLVKGDWPAGLPKLAKSSDAMLKGIALEEIAAPSDAVRKAALGDQLHDLAEKEAGMSRTAMLRRAAVHYRGAVLSLSGLSKAKVEKRLEEIVRVSGSQDEVNLIALIDSKKDGVVGEWLVKGTTLVSQALDITEIPYIPPDDYDLRVVVERKSGTGDFILGILVEGHQVAVALDGVENVSGLSRIDGKRSDQNPTGYRGKLLFPNKERLLIITVRRGAVMLTVDGQKIFDWKGDANQLSRNPDTPIRRPDVMYMVSNKSQLIVKQLTLTPLSTPGKILK